MKSNEVVLFKIPAENGEISVVRILMDGGVIGYKIAGADKEGQTFDFTLKPSGALLIAAALKTDIDFFLSQDKERP